MKNNDYFGSNHSNFVSVHFFFISHKNLLKSINKCKRLQYQKNHIIMNTGKTLELNAQRKLTTFSVFIIRN